MGPSSPNVDTGSRALEESRLAAAWPRALIAAGRAERLARGWVDSRLRAVASGQPPFARVAMLTPLERALFDARRARSLERGLEGAEARLTMEAIGLEHALRKSPGVGPVQPRISRLLIVSADGSERFYHQVEKIQARFANRLEVLLVECDDERLGASVFGRGQRARGLLMTHKEAVVRFLTLVDEILLESGGGTSD